MVAYVLPQMQMTIHPKNVIQHATESTVAKKLKPCAITRWHDDNLMIIRVVLLAPLPLSLPQSNDELLC